MPETDEVRRKATLLAATVRGALSRGVRHYNRAGELLTDAATIVLTLRSEGSFTVDESQAYGVPRLVFSSREEADFLLADPEIAYTVRTGGYIIQFLGAA